MQLPDIKLEQSLWSQGFKHVVGIDEAGRGPLAGPVVAGAAIIHSKDQMVVGVKDSKKMTAKRREEAYEKISEVSSAYGYGIVDSKEIDRIGIAKAVQRAMQGALGMLTSNLGENPNFLIIDGGNVREIIGYAQKRINSGDSFHYSIAAGSVIAKVVRDRLMHEYATKYPEYGFESHVGYGTKKHMDALKAVGPCEIHRESFKPVASLL